MAADDVELDLDAIEAELQELEEGQAEEGGQQQEPEAQQAVEPAAKELQQKEKQPASEEQQQPAKKRGLPPPKPKQAGAKPAIAARGKKAAPAAAGPAKKTMDPDLIKAILETDQEQAAPPTAKKAAPAKPKKAAAAAKKKPTAATKPVAEPEAEPEDKLAPTKAMNTKKGRPTAGFTLFKQEQLPALQGEGLSGAALTAHAKELWEALEAGEREAFEERAKAQAKAKKTQAEAKPQAEGQEDKENSAPEEGGAAGAPKKEQKRAPAKKRGRKPKAAKAASEDEQAAGSGGQPEAPVDPHARTRAATAQEEEDDDEESDREACDWEAHPAEAILGTTGDNKLIVKRKGLDLTEFGLADAAAVKRQRTQPEPAAPVSLQMLEEWEAWERGFRQSVARNTSRGALELDEIGQDSPLEACFFLGKLREGAYPLATVDRKGRDTAARFPVLGLSMVTQRALDLEKAKRLAAEAEAASLRKRLESLAPAGEQVRAEE